MDGYLNRIKAVDDAAGFVAALDDVIASELTNDFWAITLPAKLNSSSARNPELFAYVAAQNRLHAPVLFSHKAIAELIDPALQTKKKPLERHHLFPRAWLAAQGIDDVKLVNQMANYALLEWPENIDISDSPPHEYVPKIAARFTSQEWERMLEAHALPEGWEMMDYPSFLEARRRLMAAIIRQGFETLR